jgi:hypothetical protein
MLMRRAAVLALVLGACTQPPTGPSFTLGTVYRAPSASTRGLLDRRGLIHSHSVYSHDACDSMPLVNGVRDALCFDDFRRGLCQTAHDFAMLTDHRDAFTGTPYPEALLYRPDRGDRLVERDGQASASWAACPDGSSALILAGLEAGTMPVGLERHVEPESIRSGIYGDTSSTAIEMLKAAGAVALAQHTENWTPEELIDKPFDGFEMFNLHANSFLHLGDILEIVLNIQAGIVDEGLPSPDLTVVNFISEDPRYLDTWGTVLSRGAKRVTTMGTDCHRNSFPAKLADGERIDSYRRMMSWFSNHLLVRPKPDGTWDDRDLKEALRSGRLYGSFEVYGYPVGFDYHAKVGAEIEEMGSELALSAAPKLFVARPTMEGLATYGAQPEITLRILRALDVGWEEVARATTGDLELTVTSTGAYRAEVRIRPRHLQPYLGKNAMEIAESDRIWIYSNAIYVRL